MSPIIGIDLGTTTSLACVVIDGKHKMVPFKYGNFKGEDILESVIALNQNTNELEFGEHAKNKLTTDPTHATSEFKRKMGTKEKVKLGDIEYSAEELSAVLLRHIKESCEFYLGEPITEAIITVPANFNDEQRIATERAGKMAGLTVRKLFHEPTAAALAYGAENKELTGTVLVFDWGGGTLDITILEYVDEVLEVFSSIGDTALGGKDFDQVMIDYVANEFIKTHNIDLRNDLVSLSRLKNECEKAKKILSSSNVAPITLQHIAKKNNQSLHLEMLFDRGTFEKLIAGHIDKAVKLIQKGLKDKNMTINNIDAVLMVGGTTLIPMVQREVTNLFGSGKVKSEVDPIRAIAMGAGIEASETGPIVLDVVPMALGIATSTNIDGAIIHDLFSEIIEKDKPAGIEYKDVFCTMYDNAEAIRVRVYQKPSNVESFFVHDMTPLLPENLDDAELTGIPPAPAGDESVTVFMQYDSSGIVKVRAVLDSTGKEIQFSINSREVVQVQQENVDSIWEKSAYAIEIRKVMELAERKRDSMCESDQKKLDTLLQNLKDSARNDDKQHIDIAISNLQDFLFDLS